MKKNIFNPEDQQKDLDSKIISGLERISEAFKALLWEKAKVLGISPIQIQILIFIRYHQADLCNVSHLAKEFNLTKPTISDAIRVLEKKKLLTKVHDHRDQRRFTLVLTSLGDDIVTQTEDFADPFIKPLNQVRTEEKNQLFNTISKLINQLHKTGVLSVQRSCYSCRFFRPGTSKDYCALLERDLKSGDIRLDCPEYELK